MLNFRTRSLKKELLDGDSIPYQDIIQNMKELDTINTLLGGHAITLKGFQQLLGSRKKISVLEIGCGGGDNLRIIQTYCERHQIEAELSGVELNPDTAHFAKQLNPWLKVICSDYRMSDLQNKPDIIFSSLFCHHFTNGELIAQLHWMNEHAGLGFFINDLQRHPLAYYSIKLLTTFFSSSYLVKHDAPLSVARSFLKNDWVELFQSAEISSFTIKWKWAFRYLIVAEKKKLA